MDIPCESLFYFYRISFIVTKHLQLIMETRKPKRHICDDFGGFRVGTAMHFNALKHPCMLIVILGDCAIETGCEFQMEDFLPEKLFAKHAKRNQMGYTARHKSRGLGRGSNVVGRGIGGSRIHNSISHM